jgi:small GTP-binding protein
MFKGFSKSGSKRSKQQAQAPPPPRQGNQATDDAQMQQALKASYAEQDKRKQIEQEQRDQTRRLAEEQQQAIEAQRRQQAEDRIKLEQDNAKRQQRVKDQKKQLAEAAPRTSGGSAFRRGERREKGRPPYFLYPDRVKDAHVDFETKQDISYLPYQIGVDLKEYFSAEKPRGIPDEFQPHGTFLDVHDDTRPIPIVGGGDGSHTFNHSQIRDNQRRQALQTNNAVVKSYEVPIDPMLMREGPAGYAKYMPEEYENAARPGTFEHVETKWYGTLPPGLRFKQVLDEAGNPKVDKDNRPLYDGTIEGTPTQRVDDTFPITAENKYGRYTYNWYVEVEDVSPEWATPGYVTTRDERSDPPMGRIDSEYTSVDGPVHIDANGTHKASNNQHGKNTYMDQTGMVHRNNKSAIPTVRITSGVGHHIPCLYPMIKKQLLDPRDGSTPDQWPAVGHVLEYSCYPALPEGFHLERETGIITGQPRKSMAGEQPFMIFAKNNQILQKNKEYAYLNKPVCLVFITVKDSKPVLRSFSTTRAVYSINSEIPPNFPRFDGGAPGGFDHDGLPKGLQFDHFQGKISGIPTELSPVTAEAPDGEFREVKIWATLDDPRTSNGRRVGGKQRIGDPVTIYIRVVDKPPNIEKYGDMHPQYQVGKVIPANIPVVLGGKVTKWSVRRILVDQYHRDSPHPFYCPEQSTAQAQIQADGTALRANRQIKVCTEYGNTAEPEKWSGLLLDCENGYIHGSSQGLPGTYKFEVTASNSGGSSSIVLHLNVMDSRAHIISYYEAATGQPELVLKEGSDRFDELYECASRAPESIGQGFRGYKMRRHDERQQVPYSVIEYDLTRNSFSRNDRKFRPLVYTGGNAGDTDDFVSYDASGQHHHHGSSEQERFQASDLHFTIISGYLPAGLKYDHSTGEIFGLIDRKMFKKAQEEMRVKFRVTNSAGARNADDITPSTFELRFNITSSQSSLGPERPVAPQQRPLKIILLGDPEVGKTSILRAFRKHDRDHGRFVMSSPSGRSSTRLNAEMGNNRNYDPTDSPEFCTMRLPHPDGRGGTLEVIVWDTVGQERYGALTKSHYRRADGALLVFGCNAPSTWQHVQDNWAVDLMATANKHVVPMVVMNKIDTLGTFGGQGYGSPQLGDRRNIDAAMAADFQFQETEEYRRIRAGNSKLEGKAMERRALDFTRKHKMMFAKTTAQDDYNVNMYYDGEGHTVFAAIQALCHKIYHIRRGLDSDSARSDDAVYGFEEMGKRAARDGSANPLSLKDCCS